MKKDYFLERQIRNNFLYILIILVSFILLIFSFRSFVDQTSTFELKKSTLVKEIADLERKRDLILTAHNLQKENLPLDELNKILNLLLPPEEDYFSIIIALEKISQKTGFIITSYSINLQKSNPQKLSLTISGIGDRHSFLEFIKNYQFSGGRLITIDNIKFSEAATNETKIALNFYNQGKKKNPPSLFLLTQKDKEQLKEILSKTEIVMHEEKDTQYETKTNPF